MRCGIRKIALLPGRIDDDGSSHNISSCQACFVFFWDGWGEVVLEPFVPTYMQILLELKEKIP